MASVDDIVAAVVRALEMQRKDGGGGGVPSRVDQRHFKVEEFHGAHGEYSDWAFTFKRMIKPRSHDAWTMMNEVEKLDEAAVEAANLSETQTQIASELYDLLCQACRGDSRYLLKKTEDCNGVRAWWELYRKYNPKTMARMIKLLSEVVAPAKVLDIARVEEAMDEWEGKLRTLAKEYKEKFEDPVKIAIVTNMPPPAIQEQVFISLKEGDSFKMVADKVRVFVRNKVGLNGEAPMDVGTVDRSANTGGCGDHDHQEEGLWITGEQGDVDMVGFAGQCRTCLGRGHFSRECPSSKAKGKGKGNFQMHTPQNHTSQHAKGFVKGGGKGPQRHQGKGVGYQGRCFNCNEIGHKKWECTKPRAVNEVAEEVVDMSNVWVIGEVTPEYNTAYHAFQEQKKKKRKQS